MSFLLIILFQLFCIWLWLNEVMFNKQYKHHYNTPNEYSLQLSNFPSKMSDVELCKYILEMFDRLSEEYKFSGNPIIDLKIIKSRKYLSFVRKNDKLNLQLAKLLLKYKQGRKVKFEKL